MGEGRKEGRERGKGGEIKGKKVNKHNLAHLNRSLRFSLIISN